MNHEIFKNFPFEIKLKYIQKIGALCLFLLWSPALISQDIVVGAERSEKYVPELIGKRVGLVVNHTSLVGEMHLVNYLLQKGVDVKVVFAPEHGFRGKTADGETIEDGKDVETGLPIISLYGKNKKPQPDQLKGLDILIFDIQDVGTRFYTFTSTMTLCMEACAENHLSFFVLDRPNPHGHYVDGPILEMEFASFVGMHPVPVVHGLTVAEYAKMIQGEGWIKEAAKLDLHVVTSENYSHSTPYVLPIAPSPNLPNAESVWLYPSLCFFEGTDVSVGRGTKYPFQLMGAPWFEEGDYDFIPRASQSSVNPKYRNVECKGIRLDGFARSYLKNMDELYLYWLMAMYEASPSKGGFFNNYFRKLAGTDQLQQQIKDGWTEEQIRESWKPGLDNYRVLRAKYLLYEQ